MSEDKTGGEFQDQLDSLLGRLKKIESIRKSQTLLRSGCLAVVFALIGFTGVTVYGHYRHLDSGKFTQNLKKELHEEFQPDLEKLAKEGETKLLPALKEELEKSLKARLPRIQERYEKLARAKVEEIAKKFDQSAVVYFREFEAAFRKEFSDEEMNLVFRKLKETEDRVIAQLTEDVRKEMEKVRPKIKGIQDSLRKLAEKPEVRGLSREEAKDLFLEATIDLFKYEVMPSKGSSPETLGKQGNSGEGQR